MDKILFVDDERHILDAIQRTFRGKFEIHTAKSGEEGLLCIKKYGPFPVVVSDCQMPQMDGVDFLSKVSQIAPDTIRMMLTGCAQIETSIRAVNEGNVFRFLSKPCPMNVLEKALLDALHQFRLIATEREFYAIRKWNEGLGGLVQAFANLIESKDPYTAGHQCRVAALAVELAKALEFSSENIEQIRMAALVHDIGKIYVPFEFLNKPGSLNSSELNIVKMHAQVGHDILKPVNFPFPIHEIVLQHHERNDGSGYPMGLKEAEIRVEARIIAVADVIEAITHYRPYRPAKGFDEVIREFTENNGSRYDRRISDVALVLWHEKQFQFI
jgi:putative two-component system response regulator